jgi:hypothetical protein
MTARKPGVRRASGLFGIFRQRLPVMPNSGMTDTELDAGQVSWMRRAVRSAILLVLTLLFEGGLLYRFSAGKSASETWLFIGADLVLALTICGDIVGDMMAHRFQSISENRSRDRLTDALTRAAKAEEQLSKAAKICRPTNRRYGWAREADILANHKGMLGSGSLDTWCT